MTSSPFIFDQIEPISPYIYVHPSACEYQIPNSACSRPLGFCPSDHDDDDDNDDDDV